MVFFFSLLPVFVFLVVLHFLRQPITLDVILLLFLMCFMSSVSVAPDLLNYKTNFFYSSSEYSTFSGFFAVNAFFSRMGLSFYEFYMVFHTICLVIVFVSIRLIFANSFKCIVLYVIAPFLLNVVQLKNYAMMAIMLLAFAICYRCNNWKIKVALWILLIYLASMFHIAGIVYLPFIFLLGKRKILKKLPVVMIGITIYFVFKADALSNFLQPLLEQTVDDLGRATMYARKATLYGGFYFVMHSILMMYIANKIQVFYSIYRSFFYEKMFFGEKNYSFPDHVYDLTLYSSLFWPLFVASAHYSRLIENQLVLIYILIVAFFSMYNQLRGHMNENILNDYFIKTFVAFTLLMLVYIHSIWYSHWDDVVVAIMSNLKPFYAFLQ